MLLLGWLLPGFLLYPCSSIPKVQPKKLHKDASHTWRSTATGAHLLQKTSEEVPPTTLGGQCQGRYGPSGPRAFVCCHHQDEGLGSSPLPRDRTTLSLGSVICTTLPLPFGQCLLCHPCSSPTAHPAHPIRPARQRTKAETVSQTQEIAPGSQTEPRLDIALPAVEETGRPRTCQLSLLAVWLRVPILSGHLDPLLVWYALPFVRCCCQNKFPVDFPIKFSPYQVGLYHRIQNGNSLSQSRVPDSVQTHCSFFSSESSKE